MNALVGAFTCGRYADAADLARGLVARYPLAGFVWKVLGSALNQQGLYADALLPFRKAVLLLPGDSQVHSNMSNSLRDLGRLDQAETSCRRAIAISPDSADAHYNLGLALYRLGRLDEARESCRRVLGLGPDHVAALTLLGNCAKGLGRLDEARLSYRRVLRSGPDQAEAHNSLGTVFRALGQTDDAADSYRCAIAIRPDYSEAYHNLGNLQGDCERPDRAILGYGRAMVLRPDDPETFFNLAVSHQENENPTEAASCFRKALVLKPDYPECHNSMGMVLQGLSRLDDAQLCYRRAIRIRSDFPEAHSNLGLSLLLVGRFDEGWREQEWRWRLEAATRRHRELGVPRWNGEALDGRTILLHAEQGMGDAIQFCRYVPLVAARGARVVLEVHRPLMRLLAGLAGTWTLVAKGDPSPPADLHCPLMSLPHAFATRLETIPAQIPYLTAQPERIAAWRERLGQHGFRVGIVWQGNPTYQADRSRSVPLAFFEPLARIPGIRLISLQKRHGLDQLERLPEGMAVETLGEDFDEGADAFLDASAVMMNLDLVVTVDTATGHLAGALGRPVWLLLAKVPHWVWMLEGEQTPWYPTMRLFRQAGQGEWEPVFQRIATALK